MVKIIDNRKDVKLTFENIEFGYPFYFNDKRNEIYVLVDDDTLVNITRDFEPCSPTAIDENSLCSYVDLNIEIV